MTLERLLFQVKIDSDAGIYFEGKFRGTVSILMSSDVFYNAYALLDVDTITCDDVTDNLKIILI